MSSSEDLDLEIKMINILLLSIFVGVSIALGQFAYDKTYKTLYRMSDFVHNKILSVIDSKIKIIIDILKQREYINWKKYKFPNLRWLSRYNDEKGNKALAERIARSNHKRQSSWFNKKQYEY